MWGSPLDISGNEKDMLLDMHPLYLKGIQNLGIWDYHSVPGFLLESLLLII